MTWADPTGNDPTGLIIGPVKPVRDWLWIVLYGVGSTSTSSWWAASASWKR
jgi:hypothetical protein